MPEEDYEIPIGKARIVREGTDVTLVGIGSTTRTCLEAAGELEKKGHSAEIVDLLSVSPLDEDTVLTSIKKTRKIVIVDEDYPRCSVASDLAALAVEQAFDFLDAPPKRVSAPHAPVPYSPVLEELHPPRTEDVVAAAIAVLE